MAKVKEKNVRDMTREEFEAWIENNRKEDEEKMRKGELSWIKEFVKVYHDLPTGISLDYYEDLLSEDEMEELSSLIEDDEEILLSEEDLEEEDIDDELYEDNEEIEEDIDEKEIDEEAEGSAFKGIPIKPRSFLGMSAHDIAKDIMKNGIRIDELSAINDALEEDFEREEAVYQAVIKKDWLKFRCHELDHEFSISITDVNNYDASFYSKAKCEWDARNMLRKVYDEAIDAMARDKLYRAALDEIMDFVENRFTVEVIRARKELTKDAAKDLEKHLNIKVLP